MPDFPQIFKKLNEDYNITVQQQTGQAYGKLAIIFKELDAVFREHIQDLTKDEIKGIIKKLERQEVLSAEEREQLKLWMVGDADYYTKLENNVEDWKRELTRLMEEINRLQMEQPDVETAARLRGFLRDGTNVLNDLFFFAQQQDRLNRFKQSTQSLDAAEREILIRLLEQKLASPDY